MCARWTFAASFAIATPIASASRCSPPGKIDIKPLITHRFKFDSQENLIAGFEMARTGKDAIKVMFEL
jgi:threonine dehydrogenase-like Zn-dependent dehydrogenase